VYRLIILFLFFELSFIQAQNSPEFFNLKISTDQEISLHGNYFWDKAILSGNKDTVCYINNQGDFIFLKITPGKYRICLLSRFNQKLYKEIYVSKSTTVKLKSRKILKSTKAKSLFSKLRPGDTLYILHNTTGTSVEDLEFRIVKEKEKHFILKYIRRQLSLKKELDASGLDFIKKFESDLIAKKFNSGCSVIETYTMQLNGKYFSVNDNSCTWNGFYSLNTRFFTVEE
jgi:hypothetical protein